MKLLYDYCRESNFATPERSRESIRYAMAFTRRFREMEGAPAPLREAVLLEVQFPASLQPPEAGDRYLGRIRYACVNFSPEPGGFGWSFDFAGVRRWMEDPQAEEADREECRSLITFWEPRVTAHRTRQAYPDALARTLPSDAWSTTSGVGFPLYRLAGTVLDYGTLLELGLNGLKGRVQAMETPEAGFREGALAALGTIQRSIDYYLGCAGVEEGQKLVLRAIREEPPGTLDEAIQLLWLWAIHSGTWTYGRLDVILGGFLDRDLKRGTLDEESAVDRLCSWWRLMHAYSNQYNNRVVVGGRGRPRERESDRFAALAIEATRRVRLNQPQLTLRFYEGQSPTLWGLALTAIGEGCTFPMLYNDDVNIPAVARSFGVDEDLASQYIPFGCGEYVLGHYGVSTPSGVINLLKALEVALHAGVDPASGARLLDLPPVGQMGSFEDVWAAYRSVVEHYVGALAEQQKIEYTVAGQECAFLFLSLLTSDCLARGRPLLKGGVRHLGGTLETYGNSNVADSLQVIRECVFQGREFSLETLVAALRADFVGFEDVRARCLAVAKYGNDEATVDAMAQEVHRHVCQFTSAQASRVGLDSYLVVIINNWANTLLGSFTGASPEGRRRGQPMANGNNPTPGSDHSGVTAFLNSISRLDPHLHAGAVQNMKLSRDWFGPRRPRLEALLGAYFKRGGTQAMITVVAPEDLQAALKEPGKWGHLMVRVGGFTIRFVDLPPEAQQEVLARTLH